MTEREQLLRVDQRSRDLANENARLRLRLCDMEQECHELEDANANLRVERDAGDVILGEAMDALTGGKR